MFVHKSKPILELCTVRTFLGLINVRVTDLDRMATLFSTSNLHVLPNKIRWFAFKFFNNYLAIGTRVAARYRADPLVRVNEHCNFLHKGEFGKSGEGGFLSFIFLNVQ